MLISDVHSIFWHWYISTLWNIATIMNMSVLFEVSNRWPSDTEPHYSGATEQEEDGGGGLSVSEIPVRVGGTEQGVQQPPEVVISPGTKTQL